MLGRNEDAVREVNHAIELDPLNDQNRLLLAFIAFTSHQHDLAISRYKELHVSRPPLAWSYAGKGMYPEAIATAKNCEIKVGGPLCVAGLAYVYGLAGKKREAREAINAANNPPASNPLRPIGMICSTIAGKAAL